VIVKVCFRPRLRVALIPSASGDGTLYQNEALDMDLLTTGASTSRAYAIVDKL
jgi:hypothetical protein